MKNFKMKEEKLFIEKWHLAEDIEPSALEAIFFVDINGDLHVGVYNEDVHAAAMADGLGVKLEDIIQWMYVGSERELVKYPEDGETVAVEVPELGTLALGMYTDRYVNKRGDRVKAVVLEPCYCFEDVEDALAITWDAVLSWYHVPEITSLRPVQKEEVEDIIIVDPEIEDEKPVEVERAPEEFEDEIQEAPAPTSEIAQAAIPKKPPVTEDEEIRESQMKEAKDCCFGTYLSRKKDELNKITNKEALIKFVKDTCEPHAKDPEQEAYLKKMLADLSKEPFVKGMLHVYDVILKGEDLGVIKEATSTSVKYAIYCNGITKDGFDPKYEGYVGEQENVHDPEDLDPEFVFDTVEEAEEFMNSGALDPSIEYDGVRYIIIALDNFTFKESQVSEDLDEANHIGYVVQRKNSNAMLMKGGKGRFDWEITHAKIFDDKKSAMEFAKRNTYDDDWEVLELLTENAILNATTDDSIVAKQDVDFAQKFSNDEVPEELAEALEITDKDWMRMANLIAKNNNGETVAAKITDPKKAAARYVAGMKLLEPTEKFSRLDQPNSFFAPFYNKAIELNSSVNVIRDMQTAFDSIEAPEMYKNVQLGDKQKFVNDTETAGPKIRKSMLAQPGLIERAPQYDFSDDGNYFRGYLYKDILPISALGADGDVYYDIRLDYLNIPYKEYRDDMEIASEFNGVPKSDFNGEKFVQNCEYLYKKYVEPRKEEIVARQIFDLERGELAKAQRARWEKTNRWNRRYSGWEKDYAERSFKLEDFRNSPEYIDFLNLLKSKGLMDKPSKRAVLDLEDSLKRSDLEKANMRKRQPHLPGLEDFNGDFPGADFS